MSMLSGDSNARARRGLRQSGISAQDFLEVLFAGIGKDDYVEIRFKPVSRHSEWFLRSEFGDIEIPTNYDTWFGCLPRSGNSTTPLSRGRLVWCDTDDYEVTPHMVYPPATAVVKSGRPQGGYHLYWRLTHDVGHDQLVQLLKLAVLAWHGDKQCAEPARVLRLPESVNQKYPDKPLAKCVHLDDTNEYDPDDLADRLLAQALVDHFSSGQRHEMALALGAVLYRALWDVKRAERVIRLLGKLQPNLDVSDCVKACCGAWDRADEKKLKSALLKDALRDKWTLFLEALGIKSNEGDLVLEGVVVGRKEFAEQDLVSFFLSPPNGQPCLWACAAGQVQRWTGRCWQTSDRDQMHSWVFNQLSRMSVVNGGDVERYKARSAMAGSVVKGMFGRLLTEEMLPASPQELPLTNGIFDLVSREIRPHDSEARHRWVHDSLTYDPEAECPIWDGFLDFAVDDEERVLLQEFAGYCLMGTNPWQRMLWLYGKSGTGKSTYLKVLMNLIGAGGVTLPADGLSEYALASLEGKRLGLCSELSPKTLHTAMFKQLVSSDPIHVRQIYGKPFDLIYTGKLIWTSNGLPRLDQGEGVWRRVMIVEFKNEPAFPDNFLDRKLERELPGILNWALRGYDRLLGYIEAPQGKWPLPASVVKFVEEYKEAANFFTQFAEEELEFKPEFTVQGRDIHQRYREWAKDRGLEDKAIEQWGPEFTKVLMAHGLKNLGPKRVKERVVRLWQGARIKGTTIVVTETGIEQS